MENNIEYIQTVKLQENGYLVNGSMSVPNNESNRHYKDIKVWLESNTPEPEFTEAELQAKELSEKLAEAKQYLASTDWYYPRLTEIGKEVPADVVAKRIEARELINNLEVTNG